MGCLYDLWMDSFRRIAGGSTTFPNKMHLFCPRRWRGRVQRARLPPQPQTGERHVRIQQHDPERRLESRKARARDRGARFGQGRRGLHRLGQPGQSRCPSEHRPAPHRLDVALFPARGRQADHPARARRIFGARGFHHGRPRSRADEPEHDRQPEAGEVGHLAGGGLLQHPRRLAIGQGNQGRGVGPAPSFQTPRPFATIAAARKGGCFFTASISNVQYSII